jgi:hypothetical protein
LVRRRLATCDAWAADVAATQAAQHAGKLLALATDDTTRRKIGDMIASLNRGAPLPAVEDVAPQIGVGLDPTAAGVTLSEAWYAWLAGKKRLRASSHERLEVAEDTGSCPRSATFRLSG